MTQSNAYRADINYSDLAPIIIAASSPRALDRSRATLERCDARIGAAVPIEEAVERIGAQAMARALWIEVEDDGGSALDALIDQAARDCTEGRYATVISTTTALLDPIMARVGDSPIEVIVDASEMERGAALALATCRDHRRARLSDIAADRSTEQLRHLSDEVNRIATMLARLSSGPDTMPSVIAPAPSGDIPPVSVETVRKIIRARRLRSRFFAEDLFADPAWDMLLDLLQAELSHLRVPVSSLCIAAAVPATTALRWLKTMVSQGLFVRRSDPHDGRRVFVELAPETRNALHRYFAEVDRVQIV